MSDERLRFARWVQEAEAGRGNNVTAEIMAELRTEVDRLRALVGELADSQRGSA